MTLADLLEKRDTYGLSNSDLYQELVTKGYMNLAKLFADKVDD